MPESSSFVCELPLATTPEQERELAIRLAAGRQVYNACLGEALRILALMRGSCDWQRARAMPKGRERSAIYRGVIERFDFTQSALDRLAIRCKNSCWIGDHIGPHEAQAIAKRAFGAVRQCALGKRGQPRFKGKRGLHSVEGKTNAAGIRWREGRVEWAGLSIAAMLDPKDMHGWQANALASETKFCRIIRRVLSGKDRYDVQLVQKGTAPRQARHIAGRGVTGLDIGPSTVAAVGGNAAILEQFCHRVKQPWAEMRRLSRAMDRSRRAINPDHYNADSTVKEGRKTWMRSTRYVKRRTRLADMGRRLASERKRAHGELANRIIAMGCDEIRTEKLSYKAFQRHFGRSVMGRGPGMFLGTLRRKAESAGGRLVEFPTQTTRLSQTCHGCGAIERKPLAQRWHACACGVGPVHRDLYSGFLARHVVGGRLDARQAAMAWPGAEPLLRRAASSAALESARGPGIIQAHAGGGVGADRPPKGDRLVAEAVDAVRVGPLPRVRGGRPCIPESHGDAP